MKKIIALIALAVILSGCGLTYYSYSEVDDLYKANYISKQDAEWSGNRKSPSRVIAAYPDSTGHTVYLIETKIRDTGKIDYQ